MFVIERQIPGAGDLNPPQLGEAAKTSHAPLSHRSGGQLNSTVEAPRDRPAIGMAPAAMTNPVGSWSTQTSGLSQG